MNDHKKNKPTEQPVALNGQDTNKSVTHFNWFARFENQQTQYQEMLKSFGQDM
ncbi:hypothetical protein [Paraglaciecola sp.]|uniref:hypothetical protein n=1 Tax=Paraglaciecola sp. TaxID=1920173 RepID=UPI0030F43CD5